MRKRRNKSRHVEWLIRAIAVIIILLSAGMMGMGFLKKKQSEKQEMTAVDAGRSAQEEAAVNTDEASSDNEAAEERGGSAAEAGKTISYRNKSYVYNEDMDHYLFLGIDSVRNTDADVNAPQTGGRSDAIYLLSYNRRENTVQMTAIPRDTMTTIEVFNRSGESLGMTKDHLNMQYFYGDGKHTSCELSKKAVSHLLYELPIRGYVSLNMNSMPYLTKAVQGVTVTVPDDSLENVSEEFKAGNTVVLTEENTERFLRYRDINQSQSSLVRQNRQIVFLKAFGSRLQTLQSQNAHTVTDVYQMLSPYMVTNIGNDVFLKLATASYDGATATIPGTGSYNSEAGFDEYEVNDGALYEFVIDHFYKEV